MIRARSRAKWFTVIAAGVAMIAIGGSSVAQAQTPSSSGKKRKIEMTFDLTKCEPQGPNLYKCPAIDKPVCTPDFNQPDVECIRIG